MWCDFVLYKYTYQSKLVFICNFFAKLRVEVAIFVGFFGWVEGFFLSKDLTVFPKAFSLLSRAAYGCKTFKEDSFSFIELSLALRTV
jgi:hypothetical protein